MNVNGIGGVFIYADDPKSLSEWYSAQFGLEFLYYEEANTYYLEFHWREADDPEQKASTTFAIRPAKRPLGPERLEFMVNFRVNDLDALLRHLLEQGVQAEGVRDLEYGRFTWLHDPEGNRIELWQPK